MKPVALVTTKPGFEPQLREELNKLPIKKKILWTPFGEYVLENFKDLNLRVNLKDWDFKINIEILQDESYISIFQDEFNELVIEENIKNLKNLKRYIERPLNRSERKMQELMEKFPFIFENINCVVDIGSSPGGWAKMLSKKAKKVYAIDTGELKIKANNIIHIKKRAENVDFEKDINEEIDLITNDTNLYPDESLFLTLKFAKHLKTNGYIIHTLKARNLKTKKEDLEKVLKILSYYRNIKIFKIINLRANTKNELTLILKKV